MDLRLLGATCEPTFCRRLRGGCSAVAAAAAVRFLPPLPFFLPSSSSDGTPPPPKGSPPRKENIENQTLAQHMGAQTAEDDDEAIEALLAANAGRLGAAGELAGDDDDEALLAELAGLEANCRRPAPGGALALALFLLGAPAGAAPQ